MAFVLQTTQTQRYVGLSTDAKPVNASIQAGAELHETDTGFDWRYDGSAWTRLSQASAPSQPNVSSGAILALEETNRLLRKLITGLEDNFGGEFREPD